MIDSGSRSQVRPLESFKRSRFGLLAIASFIIRYAVSKSLGAISELSQPIQLGKANFPEPFGNNRRTLAHFRH